MGREYRDVTVFTQKAGDYLHRQFDFSGWIPSAETISGVVVTITPVTSPTLANMAPAISGKAVDVAIGNGVAGIDYLVSVEATSSGGVVKTLECIVQVE
jgi:hypothetical protein